MFDLENCYEISCFLFDVFVSSYALVNPNIFYYFPNLKEK